MRANTTSEQLSFQQRINLLREAKMKQTQEKWRTIGSMDFDDQSIIYPPAEELDVVETVSASGIVIRDGLWKKYRPQSNHSSGGFFGARAAGENFRRLLEMHHPYIDANSSLAGAYYTNFMTYRDPHWNPDLDYSHLKPDQEKYQLDHGIGAVQHLCQDTSIGLELGWGGLWDKIQHFKSINLDDEAREFYAGLEQVIHGFQTWVRNHAEAAAQMAETETNFQRKQNLREIAKINLKLVTHPPETFREALQWMLWFQMGARMYNSSGSLGRIDLILWPYYEKDKQQGILSDEEAVYHLASFFVRDSCYVQLGGPQTADGADTTNALSYLVLDTMHQLKIPANIGVAVGEKVAPALLKRGVELIFEDQLGIPKFLGVDNTARGFTKMGFDPDLGRQRIYAGCHWVALPGREYSINDCIKINLAKVFEVAFDDVTAHDSTPDVAKLWAKFESHLKKNVAVLADSLDFHTRNMWRVFPELVVDLLSHGPIEKGRDASHGGVDFVNFGADATALATVADSFAAVELRVDREKRLTWMELADLLKNDWAGPDGERARRMMQTIPRYGGGGTRADEYADKIATLFTKLISEKPTPDGHTMIPGLFSWAAHVAMGQVVGATPNGRYAHAQLSHGPNPDPGFAKDGAPTALATSVARVQPGMGNTAPLQIELDYGFSNTPEDVAKVMQLIRTHFDLGGTQINMNVVDKKKLLEAHADPSRHPDLVVRVTGFSAYFSSLSPEFRQMVVDRVVE